MDFSLRDDHAELRDRVRAYAAGLLDGYQQGDVQGRFPDGLVAGLAGQGLLGLRVAAAHGGLGMDAVGTGLALEELARGDFNACYPVLNAALISDVLAANATPEQAAEWLPPIARGDAIEALCLTEPEHGSDAAAIELWADPHGDGWRLTGTKASIMLGDIATHGLVFARTGGPGARGVTAFHLPLDADQVTRSQEPDVGNRAAGRCTLTFRGLPARPEHVVGGVGLGFVQVMKGFDYSRALIALMCVGAASASIDEALAYARTRQAFGGPIGRFQGLAFPLVQHLTQLRGARLLAYEALWRKDAGLDHRVEANMVKAWAPKAAVEAAHQALLAHGQAGWSERLPLGQRMRDIMGLELGDGTAQVTMLVAARALLGRDAAP